MRGDVKPPSTSTQAIQQADYAPAQPAVLTLLLTAGGFQTDKPTRAGEQLLL